MHRSFVEAPRAQHTVNRSPFAFTIDMAKRCDSTVNNVETHAKYRHVMLEPPNVRPKAPIRPKTRSVLARVTSAPRLLPSRLEKRFHAVQNTNEPIFTFALRQPITDPRVPSSPCPSLTKCQGS
jgi:hypothetical protein